MRARLFAAIVAVCAAASTVVACASSEADVPAADPSTVGPAPSAGSGVLRSGFDPIVLAPPAPAGGGHDHHQHHGHGAHGATEPPSPSAAPPSQPVPSAQPPAMPPGHHHATPPAPAVPQ